VKVVVHWSTLIALARGLGRARLSRDAAAIAAAERQLREYESMVRTADEMHLPGGAQRKSCP